MYCGKYDLENMNNGNYSLRWLDKTTGTWFKHIIPNIEEVFDQLLAHQKKDQHLSEFYRHFRMYCIQPVEFLIAQDNQFVDYMSDRWCYNQNSFLGCVSDFLQAFNIAHGSYIMLPEIIHNVAELEKHWRESFHSEPEIHQLIKSGFLQITTEDGYR